MPAFTGTNREFKRYVGPRLRNLVQAITRKQKAAVGACEHCGAGEDLEAAHVRGRDRNQIIDLLMGAKSPEGLYVVDLEQFETLRPENLPYIYCASQCISVMAMRLKEHGIVEEISYIYGDERGGQFREAMWDVIGLGERYRQMLNAHTIAPGSGIKWPGLDAADYLAWTGGHAPGYYYDRVVALNCAEFWRLRLPF